MRVCDAAGKTYKHDGKVTGCVEEILFVCVCVGVKTGERQHVGVRMQG